MGVTAMIASLMGADGVARTRFFRIAIPSLAGVAPAGGMRAESRSSTRAEFERILKTALRDDRGHGLECLSKVRRHRQPR